MVMPSFSHVSHGRGLPLAAQSSVTVLPSIITDDWGVATNTGGIMFAPASVNQQTNKQTLSAMEDLSDIRDYNSSNNTDFRSQNHNLGCLDYSQANDSILVS
jgi:hypothetical protein